MTNPDTILFSGTGELSATTVTNLLTTEKYVTIEGYNSIAPNAFKNKTDILTVTISNSVKTIGQGAFAGNNCNNITLPVRFFNDLKSTIDTQGIHVDGDVDNNLFSPSFSNSDFKDIVYVTWLLALAHLLDRGFAVGGEFVMTIAQSVAPSGPNSAYLINRWISEAGRFTDSYFWGMAILADQAAIQREIDRSKAALTNSGTKYNFTCELTTTTNDGSITMQEVTDQLCGYKPGETLGGIIQSTTPSPSLDITFDSTVKEFDEDLSFLNTNVSSVLIPNITQLRKTVFTGNTTLSSVTFVKTNTKNLNSIGEKTFNNCTALQYIILPNYITSIKANAFNNCSKFLGSANNDMLNLQSITSIKGGAFSHCSSLTTVLISEEKLTEIGTSTFMGCSKLQNIVLPRNDTYTSISDYTFVNCTSLLTMNIHKNIKSIGRQAFIGCSNLDTVYLNNGLTSIGQSAFENCGIVTLNTPPSLTDIGLNAFSNCPKLSILTLPIHFASDDNIDTTWKNEMFGKNFASNVKIEYYYIFAPQTPGSTILTQIDVFNLLHKYKLSDIYTIGSFNVYIADTVEIIDTNAFKNVRNILTVSLCDTVQEIRSGAFEGSGLQNFYIGTNIDAISNSKLTTIGDNAFNNCKITSIIIPNTVTTLGAWIFYNATELKEVIFNPPTKIDTINSYSFANCTSLEILRIPKAVRHIKEYAFAYCTNLLNIILSPSLETIGNNVFINCTTVSTLSLPYHITTIGDNAFGNISFPNDSKISISSLFKNNINSLFNSQIYTGDAKIEYDKYQDNITYYNFYIWVKKGMIGIAESTMGSKNHTLDSQRSGYFGNNSTYVDLFKSEFHGDLNSQAKPFAEAYLKVNENTGSSTADTNINTRYFSMKNSSMKLSTMPETRENISNNVFDYHYNLQSDNGTLTRQQVINQLGSNGTTNKFTASIDNGITIIEANAFENMNIGHIEFNNDITEIKSCAFKGSKLTGTLSIPSSVQSIGDSAFEDCPGITMIILPEGNLTTIGQSAFSGCGIKHIYIPKSVTSIGDSVCDNCPNLTVVTLELNDSGNVPTYQMMSVFVNINIEFSITINPILYIVDSVASYHIGHEMVINAIEETLTKFNEEIINDLPINVLIKHADISITDKIVIKQQAFRNITNLHRITMHNVSEISEEAFEGCSMLKSVHIENSIQTIGSNAFANCTNLQIVKIPSRLYDKCNFNYFTSNKSIIYLFYCILTCADTGGILNEYDVQVQLGVDNKFNNTIAVTFDTTVKILNDNAFNGNNNIDTIIIPPNIELIGEYTFANCLKLSSVICINSNPNLIQIGKHAFNGCPNLTTVRLPISLLDIGLGCFLNCPNLWSVTLPKIFDYDLLTMNNLYFESNMMKNESWKSDEQWSAGGEFFTFKFQLKKGKYNSYSWAKNNYMAQQRAKQAAKVAAHKKVVHKWDEVGEDVVTIVVVAAIVMAPELVAMAAEWLGGGAAASAGATEAAATAATDASVDAATTAATDSATTAATDTVEKKTVGSALKEATIGTLVTDRVAELAADSAFGFTVTPESNSYSVEQLANREINYGSMNGIYTVPSNYLTAIDTSHSDGSWKIITTINLHNSHENHSINFHTLKNKYSTIINQYNPTGENNIMLDHSHNINNNLSRTYELIATIPTDYNKISNEHRLAMNEAIENELSLHLGISDNNISTIITDIPNPESFPFPMITKNKRLFGVNQKLSSGLSKNMVFSWR